MGRGLSQGWVRGSVGGSWSNRKKLILTFAKQAVEMRGPYLKVGKIWYSFHLLNGGLVEMLSEEEVSQSYLRLIGGMLSMLIHPYRRDESTTLQHTFIKKEKKILCGAVVLNGNRLCICCCCVHPLCVDSH